MNRANLELIKPKFGSSFHLKHYLEGELNNKSNFWHFHPEIQLTYVKGGQGVRHIGSHISNYKRGDLVLIGSNLPHTGMTDNHTCHQAEVTVQFNKDFLGNSLNYVQEFKSINQLFQRSLTGLTFKGKTKSFIGRKMEKLSSMTHFEALMELIFILHYLAESEEYQSLSANGFTAHITHQDNDRAAKVFQYVKDNYKDAISLEDISSLASMTVPSFCRYFKKLTQKTFTNFVNEYRILEACKIITEEKISISETCFKVGFNNVAHFNNHFKKVTGVSPSKYRKDMKEVVSI